MRLSFAVTGVNELSKYLGRGDCCSSFGKQVNTGKSTGILALRKRIESQRGPKYSRRTSVDEMLGT